MYCSKRKYSKCLDPLPTRVEVEASTIFSIHFGLHKKIKSWEISWTCLDYCCTTCKANGFKLSNPNINVTYLPFIREAEDRLTDGCTSFSELHNSCLNDKDVASQMTVSKESVPHRGQQNPSWKSISRSSRKLYQPNLQWWYESNLSKFIMLASCIISFHTL